MELGRVSVGLLLALTGGLCAVAQDCQQNENILAAGRWYLYDYNIVAEASAVGSTDDTGDMKLACRVKVSHIGTCKYLFEVQRCVFSSGGGPPRDKRFWIQDEDLLELTRDPVVVTLSDGVITNLEVSSAEPEHLLNIKRALVSAFVLKRSHLLQGADTQRTDIHGTCPWKMVPGSEAGTAHSSKDMLYCSYPERADWHLSPWAVMWNLHWIQYLINSTVDCDYAASEGMTHLKSLRCHERHAIKLESTHDTTTAVQTNIVYTLTLDSEGALEQSLDDFSSLLELVPAGIEYKHLATPDPSLSTLDGAELELLNKATFSKLEELVQTAETEVQLFTIPLFHEFIELLRSHRDLLPFVELVANCDRAGDDSAEERCTQEWKSLAMSFLQDALIQSNNFPTLRAFRHLATHGHVSDAYLPLAFHSWSFLRINDPRYMDEVFEICKSTDQTMCWLLLGRMMKKHKENYVIGSAVPLVFGKVLKHITSYIGERCHMSSMALPPASTVASRVHHLVMMLKTIGNAGMAAHSVYPNITGQLLNCAHNHENPGPVAVFAIEALREFHLNYDTLSALKTILSDPKKPLELRVAVYKLLTREPDRWKFGKMIQNSLEGEEVTSDLMGYIVSDFLDWMPIEARASLVMLANGTTERRFQDVIPGEKFYKALRHTVLSNRKYRRSNRRTFERRVELPFLPPELRDFAVKAVSDQVFGGWKNLISDLSSNISLQLFGNEFRFADVSVFFKELDHVIMNFGKLEGGQWKVDWDAIEEILSLQLGAGSMPRGPLARFPKLRAGLKKILEVLPPIANLPLAPVASLNMFGSDLLFASYGEILAGLMTSLVPQAPLPQLLKEGVRFDLTRTIRIIEGHHQVPTLIGLPLNWTTSATLVTSVRTGAKLAEDGAYKAHIHPSGALTFLNRMLLDFPTKTRVGVQANSSAYTTTQLRGGFALRNGKIKVELEVPRKEQKLLQLVRTNQLIKHDRVQEMEDWDVERVNVDWCTGGHLGQVTGLQLCHDRSYANVTHLIKPWFPMAAHANWQLVLKPYSDDITSYVLDITSPSQQDILKIELQAKGATTSNGLTLRVVSGNEIELFVTKSPFLRAAIKRETVTHDDKSVSAINEAVLGFAPKQQMLLTYEVRSKQEKRAKSTKDSNEAPKGQTIAVAVHERALKLATPFNSYGIQWIVNTLSTGTKADFKATFERGPQGSNEFLREIVADEFFTEGGSAWVHIQLHQKNAVPVGKYKMSRTTLGHVTTPKTEVDLVVHSLSSKLRQLTQVNLTKVEKSTQRLLAFANFSREHWMHVKGDVTKRSALYNLTVSHHSWALRFDEESRKRTGEVARHLSLLSEKMEKKQSDWGFFSTWWHPSTSHLFEQKLRKTELSWSTKPIGTSKDLIGTVSIAAKLSHSAYDSTEPQEFLLYGNITLPPNKIEVDLLLEDPKRAVKWESHTSAADVHKQVPTEVTHRSTLKRRDAFDATYQLQFRSRDEPCPTLDFRHNVTMDAWKFSSNISTSCNPPTHETGDSSKLNMLITIASVSDVWDFLNLNLNQVFEFGNPGSEAMDLTHTFGKVSIRGRWDAESFVKEAKFWSTDLLTSPSEIVFNSEKESWILDAKWMTDQTKSLSQQISLSKSPKRSGAAFIYDAKMYDTQAGIDQERKEVRFFKAVVVPRSFGNVLMGIVNETLLAELLLTSESFAANWLHSVALVLNDRSHPLNRMLHPLIEVPVGELTDTVIAQLLRGMHHTVATAAEVAGTFHSLYDPIVFTSTALAQKAMVASGFARAAFHQSIPGWAFYYFRLDSALHAVASDIPGFSAKLAKIYFTRPVGLPGMREVSFELPHLPPRKHLTDFLAKLMMQHPTETWTLPRLQRGQKLAAIFGKSHVMTFDGAFVEFPTYPASYCTYLLSHDVAGRQFSMTSTAEDLLIDFPEVSITVTGPNGKVLLNGSDTPVHLPLITSSGKVTVHREGRLTRIQGHGLHVYCDSVKFFCTFVLDPTHHGNLIGVLGNADGDVQNDLELPNGKTAKDTAELAAGFEVSGYAECKALVAPLKNLQASTEDCTQQMPQSLKHCLAQMKIDKLVRDVCEWDVTAERSICDTFNAVAAICNHHGFQIENVHCDPCHDGPEAEGQKTFRTKSSKVLEVGVVVAESTFTPEALSSVLSGAKNLLAAVHAVFGKLGYRTKHVFAFGGSDEHGRPYVRTTGEGFFISDVDTASKLLKAVKSDGKHGTANLAALLDYVLDTVPFDAQATRVILAFASNDFNSSRAELDGLHAKTEASGATLYAFSNYPTVDRGKRIYGVRADGLVFPPSKTGEDYLDYPSRAGILAKIAAATRGSAFQIAFVEAGKPREFFEAVAEEVAAKVGKELKECRDCTCTGGRGWDTLARCRPVAC
uniref:Putative apolipoprotein b n=1 Tax=Ixodes ricinus TaxID=34613 RepID=V5HDM9_IXORI